MGYKISVIIDQIDDDTNSKWNKLSFALECGFVNKQATTSEQEDDDIA